MGDVRATRGFDYLRIFLAVAVVAWHSVMAAYGRDYAEAVWNSPLRVVIGLVLPMFFALSGYLVAGSMERSRSIEGFLALRAIRIVPALAVEVLLSALVLGPLLTTLPLGSYFGGEEFRSYFLNIVGDIHFRLPGVFSGLPRPGIVNLSLWTIPFELECYATLTVLAAIGLFRRRALFVAAAIAFTFWWTASLGALENVNLAVHGRALVIAFLAGVSVYLFRDRIPRSAALAAACAFASMLLLYSPLTQALAMWPAAYLTVWLGLQDPPKLAGGDYSYGVYLFAFPLQQTAAIFLPREWWINFAAALVLAFAYAAFSWHCVEKPCLDRKRIVVGFVERWRRRSKPDDERYFHWLGAESNN
jgi:peptidoglycan/LPS O-acetylase OafA/YrhL